MTTASSTTPNPRRSARNLKRQHGVAKLESPDETDAATAKPAMTSKRIKTEESPTRIKREDDEGSSIVKETRPTAAATDRAANLQARKLKSFSAHASKSPFPDLARPTPAECQLAHRILARLHGDRTRPDKVVAPTGAAGCGNSPSVLDALVRTILSQNTSDSNSSRAKRSMDDVYGGSDRWDAIVAGGQARLQKAIQSGGLSVVKSRVIIGILDQVKARYGVYSLDHLFSASDDDAMREMLSFQGVGPKTASCVLLFCLRRASFAVDTHVYRLTGLLGWRPATASREEAQAHLDARIPPEEKYPLHVLFINHGKKCAECRAGGKKLGRCELRKAFRRGVLEGEAGEGVKEEEAEQSEGGLLMQEEEAVKQEESLKQEESIEPGGGENPVKQEDMADQEQQAANQEAVEPEAVQQKAEKREEEVEVKNRRQSGRKRR